MQPCIKWLPICLAVFIFQANALEVESTGYGRTRALAIENAKISALSQITGELILSDKKLDKTLQNEVYSYSGGIVDSYEVLDESCAASCTVKIKAVITQAKNNDKAQSTQTLDIPQFYQEGKIDGYLTSPDNIYVVKIIHVEYVHENSYLPVGHKEMPRQLSASGVEWVTVILDISLNPKWLSDYESYLKLAPQTAIHTILGGTSYPSNLFDTNHLPWMPTKSIYFGKNVATGGIIPSQPLIYVKPCPSLLNQLFGARPSKTQCVNIDNRTVSATAQLRINRAELENGGKLEIR